MKVDGFPELSHGLDCALTGTGTYQSFVDAGHSNLHNLIVADNDPVALRTHFRQEQMKGIGAHINNGDLGHKAQSGVNLILYSAAIYLFYDHSGQNHGEAKYH
jgi:hypothetical protein